MGDADPGWLEKGIEAATALAVAVGVPGAALLIVAIGMAWRLDKIMDTLKGMLRDHYDFRLQRDELHHRMRVEGERLEADAHRELRIAVSQKGSEI